MDYLNLKAAGSAFIQQFYSNRVYLILPPDPSPSQMYLVKQPVQFPPKPARFHKGTNLWEIYQANIQHLGLHNHILPSPLQDATGSLDALFRSEIALPPQWPSCLLLTGASSIPKRENKQATHHPMDCYSYCFTGLVHSKTRHLE